MTEERRSVTLKVPVINDAPREFDKLFSLWRKVDADRLNVTFDFTRCRFLRPNAVAFLGGLARLVERRGGRYEFRWDTMPRPVRVNLRQNGFAASFGDTREPWKGHSIPYREDAHQAVDEIADYLSEKWLDRRWVQVSQRLRHAIVGRVWEIYDNAFEHAQSKVGVFSCGQHFARLNLLKLAVVDFGVGIPANVRRFKRNDPGFQGATAAACLRWALRRGTSTKTGGPGRGIGLGLLKEFVSVNNGTLEIYSDTGYVFIDRGREVHTDRNAGFRGTAVNITLQCDERFYQFADEAPALDIF